MFSRAIIVVALATGCSVSAAERPTESPTFAQSANSQAVQDREALTGKERLGEKWTDEQRLDNCNVPKDKRGEKPRPDTCHSKKIYHDATPW